MSERMPPAEAALRANRRFGMQYQRFNTWGGAADGPIQHAHPNSGAFI